MSIEQFLSVVRSKGLARTEKFSVRIFPPSALTVEGLGNDTLMLMCEEAAFPGKTVLTRAVRIHNLNIQRPSSVDFFGESAQFTFFMDSEWKVKTFFDNWMDKIIGISREVSPYNDIRGDIEIYGVHEGPIGDETSEAYKETIRYKVKLHDAFPKSMNLMQMSYSTPGIHRLNMGFAYKYWTVENINQG